MSDSMVCFVFGASSISITIDGTPYTITEDHANFENIKNEICKDEIDSDLLRRLIDMKSSIEDFSERNFEVKNGDVYYKGQAIDNVLTRRIIDMLKEGVKATPLIKFLDNLLENPSLTAVKELYSFLETNDLPITPDGQFIAYKNVTKDFLDIYTKSIDNSPGKIVEMTRNLVDDNRHRTCSAGLHFCSKAYLKHYNVAEGKTVIVKVNPKDVVSIPSDYNNTKGRCCKYEVMSELKDVATEKLQKSVLSD